MIDVMLCDVTWFDVMFVCSWINVGKESSWRILFGNLPGESSRRIFVLWLLEYCLQMCERNVVDRAGVIRCDDAMWWDAKISIPIIGVKISSASIFFSSLLSSSLLYFDPFFYFLPFLHQHIPCPFPVSFPFFFILHQHFVFYYCLQLDHFSFLFNLSPLINFVFLFLQLHSYHISCPQFLKSFSRLILDEIYYDNFFLSIIFSIPFLCYSGCFIFFWIWWLLFVLIFDFNSLALPCLALFQ